MFELCNLYQFIIQYLLIIKLIIYILYTFYNSLYIYIYILYIVALFVISIPVTLILGVVGFMWYCNGKTFEGISHTFRTLPTDYDQTPINPIGIEIGENPFEIVHK